MYNYACNDVVDGVVDGATDSNDGMEHVLAELPKSSDGIEPTVLELSVKKLSSSITVAMDSRVGMGESSSHPRHTHLLT